MDTSKVEKFVRSIVVWEQMTNQSEVREDMEGDEGMIVLFRSPVSFFIGVTESPDDIKETELLISEGLRTFGDYEFNFSESLPVGGDEIGKTLLEALKKSIICLVDRSTFENWKKVGWSDNNYFLLDRSYIAYL